MPALDRTQANAIINATLAGTAVGASTGIKMYLGSNVPSATVDMTEITGTGYSRTVVTWNAASGGSATNSSAPSLTNGSGSAWSIQGIELWDEAGSPVRWWFGTWTPSTVTINNTDVFSVAAGAITCSLS